MSAVAQAIVRRAGAFPGARGVRIFTQSWEPETVRAAVVLVHGFGEHSDRYDHVGRALAERGFAVHAGDHRGHGRSEGPRAVIRVADVLADVDRLVADTAAAHPGAPVFMLGHSLGGMLAARYAAERQDRLAGLILSGALAAVEAPAAVRAAGRAVAVLAPRLGLLALDPTLVSRDPAVVAAYRADPLVHHRRIPARTLAEIATTVGRLPDAVGAITLPTLILYGTADGLCPPAGSVMLAERIGAADLTVRAYEGLFHEVLNEPERAAVLADVIGWLDRHLTG